MKDRTVLILTKRKLCRAPRVRKEIDFIRDQCRITAIGYSDPKICGVDYLEYKTIFYVSKFRRRINKFKRSWNKRFGKGELQNVNDLGTRRYQKRIDSLLGKIKPNFVIIHEPEWLSFIAKDDRDYKVIFNAHEFYPKQLETSEWQKKFGRLYRILYRDYLNKVDLLINVSDGIANECLKEYGAQSVVITNAANYVDLNPQPRNPGPIRLIYHGGATPSRNLENIIFAVSQYPKKFTLDLMIEDKANDYTNQLRQLADKSKNVNILKQVPYEKIVTHVARYDLGIHLLPDTCFNHRYALPNKIFEYIQARLGLIVSPLPEMKKLVKSYKIGIVTEGESAQDCVDALAKINVADVENYKRASHSAAQLINAKKSHEVLVNYLIPEEA